MAKKPTVTTIASGYYSRNALNSNFEALRDGFDNTLSLDGSSPNAMGADLDMNSNDILNAKDMHADRLYLNGEIVTTVTAATARASDVNFTPVGNISSTDVQAALAEVDTKQQERVSVKDFGAVGDGSTDDTVAIQAAIDSVEAQGGGTVHFPEGTYIVSDTLTIDNNGVFLLGDAHPVVEQLYQTTVEPKGSVIKLADGAFNTSSKPIVEFIYQGTGSEARLGGGMENLVVFGNRSLTTANPAAGSAKDNNAYGIGVKITGARYVTLRNNHFAWCAEDGIAVTSGGSQSVSSNNIVITGNACLSNSGRGMLLAGGDSLCQNNTIGYNGQSGVSLTGWGVFNANLVWNNQQHGMYSSGTSQPPTITSNKIYDNKSSGIYIAGGNTDCMIIGNTILRNNRSLSATTSDQCGIFVASSSTDGITITGNTIGNDFDSYQKYGIYFNDASTIVRSYAGNNLINNATANLFKSDIDNIKLEDTELSNMRAFGQDDRAITTTAGSLFDADTDGAVWIVSITHIEGTTSAWAMVSGDSTTPLIITQNSTGADTYTFSVSSTVIRCATTTGTLTSNWKAYRLV